MRSTGTKRILAGATLAAVAISAAFPASLYLQVDGIAGTSRAVPGAHEVLSYSHGITQTGTTLPGGGGGAGKLESGDLVIVKPADKSSPELMKACATGKHIKEALLTVRKAGGKQENFLVVKMENVLISSYQTGASEDDKMPVDSLSLSFAKISYSYQTAGTSVTIDLAENSVE